MSKNVPATVVACAAVVAVVGPGFCRRATCLRCGLCVLDCGLGRMYVHQHRLARTYYNCFHTYIHQTQSSSLREMIHTYMQKTGIIIKLYILCVRLYLSKIIAQIAVIGANPPFSADFAEAPKEGTGSHSVPLNLYLNLYY